MKASDLQRLNLELSRLQAQRDGRCIVLKPAPIGLGGQIAGRLEMLALGLALNRQAVFLDVRDFPYGQTFLTMSARTPPRDDLGSLPLVDVTLDQIDEIVVHDPVRHSVHSHSRALRERIEERLGISIGSELALEGTLLGWMQPTSEMQAFADAAAQRLGIASSTLGVHFRRGDKKVETPPIPPAEFNRRIAEVHARSPFSTLFLASDSAEAASLIVPPTGVRLIFDREEQRFNNANHKMLLRSPELADQETRVAYKNIALLGRCGGVVGQDNAHFAILAAAAIVARTGRTDTIELLDGRLAEGGSPLVRFRYKLWWYFRRLVLHVLPRLRTTERAKRLQSSQRP